MLTVKQSEAEERKARRLESMKKADGVARSNCPHVLGIKMN